MKVISAMGMSCVLVLSVALSGCGSSDNNGNNTQHARVRVINALTGTNSNVDVSVNGTPVASSLPFGSVTTRLYHRHRRSERTDHGESDGYHQRVRNQ